MKSSSSLKNLIYSQIKNSKVKVNDSMTLGDYTKDSTEGQRGQPRYQPLRATEQVGYIKIEQPIH